MIAITFCTPEQYRDVQGIHLNAPDLWYMQDALQTAERDGFATIFCHYECVGPALYKIPYNVLNLVSKLSRKAFKIHFTDPCN